MRRFTSLVTTLAVTMSGLVISSVQADTRHGLSLAISPTAQAKAKVTKPSAPTISAISSSSVKKGKVNVKVTITLPASNGGSKITGSKITAGGKTCTIAKTKTSCTLKSIKNGKALTVTATSKNKKGFSPASTSVAYTAGASAWPGTPAAPAVSVVADAPAASSPAASSPAASSPVATDTTISVAAIAGVTVPVQGATPVTTTTAGTGYTGTVSWSGSPATYALATTYTATITLTPTSGYTLTGVAANFFTVAGATTDTNSANSGVITAVFPATASTYAVGNTGPGGGIVFYVDSAGFSCGSGFSATGSPTGGKCNYLEAAPTTGASAWTDVRRSWSTGTTNQDATVANATGTAIGTGYKNSVAIVAQSGNVAATSAAVEARAYRGPNNLSDWFLPSKDELNQLYLRKTDVGGFVNYYYWSSSEHLSFAAWDQSFTDVDQDTLGKGGSDYVRPVRAF